MPRATRNRILFGLFFLSGFCGLAYQVVWLRLAYAAFGIITPVLSVVISVFMLGLALGSWGGGRWIGAWSRRTGLSPILFYAAAEAVIGLSAFAVPPLFDAGQRLLLPLGAMDSASYLAVSGLVLGASILPWCVAMGATFPLVMAFVKEVDEAETTSFSFLYLANVVGAMAGTATTAVVLIELLGFQATLAVGAALNFAVAATSVWLGVRHRGVARHEAAPGAAAPPLGPAASPPALDERARDRRRLMLAVLFLTGFSSMGAEVAWIRNFTPILGTLVYAFALVLFVYLLATWIGSWVYRRHLARGRVASNAGLVAAVAIAAWLPVVLADPRITQSPALVVATIVPFCALLGYLTPKLVDRYAGGAPRGGGRAYAVNVVGSILGPLVVSYLLLPLLGARFTLALLGLPFAGLLWVYRGSQGMRRPTQLVAAGATLLLLLCGLFVSRSFEEGRFLVSQVRRDHTATVVSAGAGMDKHLQVNGVGMTSLLPVTKVMAHMPMAFLDHEPKRALVISFGMGTTYRSLMRWGVDVTAVELVESVRDAFPYYFHDAEDLLRSPRGRVVIDDGRRFLQRTELRFDSITLDPAPPAEAAGSSLLYSVEFCALAKARLAEGGILHHWYPGGRRLILQAVARALVETFPHVRAYRSVQGWGFHFLASEEPFETPTPELFVSRMPPAARADLVEWNPRKLRDPRAFAAEILRREVPVESLLHPDPAVVVTDDRPFNEYFLLRRAFDGAGAEEPRQPARSARPDAAPTGS